MATPSGAECEAPSWDALHLFPLHAERIVVARWYWLVGGPVLLWLAIAAYMMGKPNPWGGRFELAWFLSDPYLLILIGGLFCGGIVFMPWERTLRRLVPSLRDRRVVRGESPEQTRVVEYRLFADFGRWLGSPWRYAFIATFIAFTVVASIAFGMHNVIFNWWEWAQSTRRSGYFVAIFIGSQVLTFFLWSYAAGSATWCFVSSARLLRELPRRFRISVVWGHPDNCGGFREIGSCCLGMAGPLIIAGVVLALWLLVPDTDRLTYAVACVALVAVVLPMTVVVFIVPLWAIHRAMAECRQLYRRLFATL